MKKASSFRRILVAVDGEGLARHAVEQAFQLADGLGANLELVHAVQIPEPLWPGISDKELASYRASASCNARQAVLERLEKLRSEKRYEHVAGKGGGERASLDEMLRVAFGHPAKVILRTAEESRADLIVLGPHERRSLYDFGSTTRAILSRATIPVWNQIEPAKPIGRILVAVDFSEHSRLALDMACELAQNLDATLEIVHCYTPPSFAYAGAAEAFPGPTYVIDHDRKAARECLDELVDQLDEGSLQIESTFLEGDPVQRIAAHASSSDLVILGTHGRTGLTRFLIGSVAHGVLRAAEKPVLVVPSPRKTWLLGSNEDTPVEAKAETVGS